MGPGVIGKINIVGGGRQILPGQIAGIVNQAGGDKNSGGGGVGSQDGQGIGSKICIGIIESEDDGLGGQGNIMVKEIVDGSNGDDCITLSFQIGEVGGEIFRGNGKRGFSGVNMMIG